MITTSPPPRLHRWGQWGRAHLDSRCIAVAVAVAALTLGLGTLRDYGLTYDTPSLFYAGDRTLFWLEHPTRDPLNLREVKTPPEGFRSAHYPWPSLDDVVHYPVLPGFVTSVVSQVFADKTGWLSDLDSRNLGLLLFHCAGLLLFTYLSCRLMGRRAALFAGIAVALYPTVLSHAYNDAKDWPCGLLYGDVVLLGGLALFEVKPYLVVAAAVLSGVALACKLNAVFAVATLALWTPAAAWLLYRGRPGPSKRFWWAFAATPLLAVAVFILLWPWLYVGASLADFGHRLHDYLAFMIGFGEGGRGTWTNYPLRCMVSRTPPILLFTALWAVVRVRGRSPRETALWLLFLLWLLLIVLRIARPHSNFYDASRHFIEYIPGLCGLAALGAVWFWRDAAAWLRRLPLSARRPQLVPLLGSLALLIALGGVVLPVVKYHPYENSYFNFLVGGLGGAQRKHLLSMPADHDERTADTESDYWYSSLRPFLRRYRGELENGATLGLCGPSELQARADWEGTKPLSLKSPREADLVFTSPRFHCLDQADGTRPVFEERRGGGLIYRVYRNPAHQERFWRSFVQAEEQARVKSSEMWNHARFQLRDPSGPPARLRRGDQHLTTGLALRAPSVFGEDTAETEARR
jgi:hypothetical protein